MDDLELEARLRARLHRRFDGAEPPATLRPVLADVGAPRIRALPRSVSIAWLAVATLVVAIAAGLGLREFGGPGGPLGGHATPSPSPTVYARHYIVLPSTGFTESKALITLAVETLNLRIRTIGVGTFSSSAGYGITFDLPADVDDALVRTVLGATGELSFVPLPSEDYDSGGHEAVIGQPLPVEEPELFGGEQVASAGVGTTKGVPSSVHFDLKPAAAAALDVYTSGHIMGRLAILIDGKVAAIATILAPITSGRLEISAGDGAPPLALAAIVTSGTLPEGWRSPDVPVVIGEGDARSLAVAAAASPDAEAVSASLSTYDTPAGDHIAAWIVDLTGTLPDGSCTSSPLASPVPSPCAAVDRGQVTLDAVTGEILDSTFR